MQRLLSLFFTILLIFISICCLPVSADSSNSYEDEFYASHFEDISNWGIYCPNVYTNPPYIPTPTFDGESCQTTMSWNIINNDVENVADGSDKSVKIKGNKFNVAVNLPTLKANTEYTLSFKYKPYANSSVGADNCYFTSRIIKKGTPFNEDGNYPASYIAKLEKATETTDWKELSVSFKTDASTDYMLEFRFDFGGGYVCYLDDFKLTDKTYNYEDEFYASHFEDISNWGIYYPNVYANSPYIPTPTFDGESCQTTMSWNIINNDVENVADGSDKSVKIKGNKFNVAVNLPTLKANTEYTLSFKYKPYANSSVGADNCYFTSRIIKKGTPFNEDGNYPASYIAELEKATETTDWKELSVCFKTDASTDYMLELRFDFGGGYMCYLDDFNLTRKTHNVATVTTSHNSKAALKVASQSTTKKNGLRVYNSISKQFLSDNYVTEYGSIVCREDLLNCAELTLNTENSIKGIAYNSVTLTNPIIYSETDQAYMFTAYLTNIPTTRYDENYSIRAYAIDSNGNVYYGDTIAVCVFDIAHAIDCGNTADGLVPTDDDIATFNIFANYDGNYEAYDTWLTANGKTAGTLRN